VAGTGVSQKICSQMQPRMQKKQIIIKAARGVGKLPIGSTLILLKLCGCMGFSTLSLGCSLKCGVCKIQSHVKEFLAKQGP
jgi:hypothetical protein